jgi:hypothetical protein
MGNTGSYTKKAHKHGNVSCTQKHHRGAFNHSRRHRRRQYKGGISPSPLHKMAKYGDTHTKSLLPLPKINITSRKNIKKDFEVPDSPRKKTLRANYIKTRNTAAREEKMAKTQKKDASEGFGPSSTRGRFKVSEKVSPLSSFAEEEEE